MTKLQILIATMLIASSTPGIAEEVISVWSTDCTQGIHKQPRGPFALYVFCDGALGRNVAVFLDRLGAPLAGKYSLGKRFWQDEEWGNDVTSYSWLKDNHLVLATSRIYGTGAVYKLNLGAQTFEIIRPPDQDVCVTKLKLVQGKKVEIGITHCETQEDRVVEIAL